jgi:hypothetical protein
MLSAHLRGPFTLVKGFSTTISCPIYEHSALHHASSGTYEIVDASFNVVLSGPLSIVSHIATVTTTTTLAYGDRYRILFNIVLTDGRVVKPENELYVVRQVFYPVVSGVDLYARVPGLDPTSTSPHSSYADYNNFLDEAWYTLMNRLISKGNRPHLILSNTSLREAHISLTLSMIFEDFSTRLNAEWGDKATAYHKAYEAAWDNLVFNYEDDKKNLRRKSATPTIWLA